MKISVCNMCMAQKGGAVTTLAAFDDRRITIDGKTYKVDLCENHEEKWYQALITLLRTMGEIVGDATPEPKAIEEAPEPKPVDERKVLDEDEPDPTPAPIVDEVPKPAPPPPRPLPEGYPDYLPRPRPDGKVPCPKPGCGAASRSPEGLVQHMRGNHLTWYYSDDSRPFRAPGPNGDTLFCDINECGMPAIGPRGMSVHQRTAHPREYARMKAEREAAAA